MNNQKEDLMARRLACSASLVDFSKRKEHFGFKNLKQVKKELEVLVEEKNVLMYKLLNEFSKETICNLRKTISESLKTDLCTDIEDEHAYAKNKDNVNGIPLAVADSTLIFYEMYQGLSDLGAMHLLLKSNFPYSIGLEHRNTFCMLRSIHDYSNEQVADNTRTVLAGHLQTFGFEEIEVEGDGNCFFTAVAFSY